MANFRDLFQSVRRRPGMYLLRPDSFDDLVSYVNGVDAGSSGALLAGFYEFLLLRLGEQDNLAWPGLVERIAFPGGVPRPRSTADEGVAVAALFDLLDEFLAEVRGTHERRRLFHEYVVWAIQQPGYSADLIRFNSSPPSEQIDVDTAAALLGMTRAEVFDLIAGGELHAARMGASVFLRAKAVHELVESRRQ
jgi:excisionase family DNA binding protein